MKSLLTFKVSIVTLLLSACVTINVYFPAGAAEKAADQIIDSVIKGGVGARPSPANAPSSGSAPLKENTSLLQFVAGRVLEALVPVAHAQPQANMDVSSAEIRAITQSMQRRFGQLERFFDAGVIGLTAKGLIGVRDISAAALPDRALVKRLVAEDNADRDALYEAIARENERPEWEADIRRIFAERWVERGAKPGWYFQDNEGNWKRR
ncbi:MAG: YdbL family protein [Gammaproteobacteria bacterium]